ncbi:MAG: hypothetical protein NTU93_18645, partial [Arthrobacter sp.]|nr:hypothetical protein [Arthrobacter sp.]
RLSFFEAQLGNRVYMARLSEKGVDARQDRAARYEAAMLSIGMKMKAGAKPMDALKEVAAEYPDVAMRLLEKGLQI